MNKMIRSIVIFFLFCSIFVSVAAQNGKIAGNVVDKTTGEELIGATVIIKGTNTGSITDLDGNFMIQGLKTGTYNIEFRYISYETQVVEVVAVKDGEVTKLNFTLTPVSMGLTQVNIKAKAIKRTENALLTLKRKSAGVMDGISAQQISRTGDGDAASALKRVTGLSVEGGKYVYIRGLGDRYSNTVLNGAQIPGLDPNRNTVQMDLFPSNIIETMVVYKTFTPDLPGNFAGGFVDIITRDFPEKFTFTFNTSLGFNPQSNLINNFLTGPSGKTDWIGIDDGNRAIPTLANQEIPELYAGFDDHLDEISRSFNKNMAPVRTSSFLNHSQSASVGNQVNFLGNPLGFIAGITYSRGFKYYNDGAVGRYRLVGSNSEKLNKEMELSDEKGTTQVLAGAMLNLSYKFSPNNKVSANVLRNQSGEHTARFQEGIKPSDDPEMFYQTRSLQFLERAFTNGQLKGEHFFKNLGDLKVNWLSSFTQSSQNEPDLRFFTNDYYINGTDTSYSIQVQMYPAPSRYYREMAEMNWDNKLDFELPLKFFERPSKVKVGGAFLFKQRTFEEKRFNFVTQQPNEYNDDISTYLSNDYIGQLGTDSVGNYGLYVQNSVLDDQTNSYEAFQTVSAAYAMLDFLPLPSLRTIIGVRMEKTYSLVESMNPNKPEGELDNLDFLPALNMTYSFTEMMKLRFAGSRTLARPSFRELAPYASFSFVGDYVLIGNENLQRTLVDNFDLRWEYYMQAGEIISISGFYKKFTNPIERTFNPEAGNDELTWRNVELATLWGVELEFRKKLDFINALRDFKIGGNLTIVQSQVNLDEKELENIRVTEPDHPDTRVMFGQSPYIVNALLSYQNDSIGLSANLAYNVAGKRMVTVILGGTPNIYEQPRHLMNFIISKSINKHWSVKFAVDNMFDAQYKETYSRWDEISTWKAEEYVFHRYMTGRTFKISVSYKI